MKHSPRLLLLLTTLFLAGCGGNNPPAESSSSKESSPEQTTSQQVTSESKETSSQAGTSEGHTTIEESAEESSERLVGDSSEAVLSSEEPPVIDNHEIYDGYYKDLVSWTDGEDLKQQLHAIIHGGTYQPIEYNHNSKSNWLSNQDADRCVDDYLFVDDVYSGVHAKSSSTATSWQREHAFCASLMTGSQTGQAVKHLGRATDFHNLFASNASANSSRGNKNYGVADKSADTYQNRLDKNGDGYSFDNKNFEPSDYDKGRLSRAIFYMGTMYCEEEYDEANDITMAPLTIVEGYVDFVAGNDCAFAHGNLSALLEWSKFDVDLQEYQHNESVYSFVPELSSIPENNHAQGNRNPYVDFPGLVDYVYGDKKNEAGTLDDMVSSYESLGKFKIGVEHYAIKEARRSYAVGDKLSEEDISLVCVDYDGKETGFVDFSFDNWEDGHVWNNPGNYKITIKTPINLIDYTVNVVSEDPLAMAQYQHNLTAKSAGQDFENCFDNAGKDNLLTFSGVQWNVYWETGEVASNSAKFGVKFGKNASSPVKTLRFISASAFSFNGLNKIMGIYLSGSTAADGNYNLKIKVGNAVLYSGNFNYVDTEHVREIYGKTNTPLEGVISIEITNITNAVYVKTIAVVLQDAD